MREKPGRETTTTEHHVNELCHYLVLQERLPAITLFKVPDFEFILLRVAISQSNQLSIQN
jgi:hypothetical protein